MKKTNYVLFAVALALTYVSSGCASGPPNPGFRIETFYTENGSIFDDPYRGLDLERRRTYPPTTGSEITFTGVRTNGSAYFDADNGIAPADWFIKETDGGCAGQEIEERINPGESEDVYCNAISIFAFVSNPSYIDAGFPPSYVTVSGTGLSTVGGMPKVEYFDQNGNLVDEVVAFEVASNGTWARGYTPDLMNQLSGSYTMRVRNPNGQIVGSGFVNVNADCVSGCSPSGHDYLTCQQSGGQMCTCHCTCE